MFCGLPYLVVSSRYDAVTIDGSGGSQNKLNQKNKPFFDLCDGILVNYLWEVPYLFFLSCHARNLYSASLLP